MRKVKGTTCSTLITTTEGPNTPAELLSGCKSNCGVQLPGVNVIGAFLKKRLAVSETPLNKRRLKKESALAYSLDSVVEFHKF